MRPFEGHSTIVRKNIITLIFTLAIVESIDTQCAHQRTNAKTVRSDLKFLASNYAGIFPNQCSFTGARPPRSTSFWPRQPRTQHVHTTPRFSVVDIRFTDFPACEESTSKELFSVVRARAVRTIRTFFKWSFENESLSFINRIDTIDIKIVRYGSIESLTLCT